MLVFRLLFFALFSVGWGFAAAMAVRKYIPQESPEAEGDRFDFDAAEEEPVENDEPEEKESENEELSSAEEPAAAPVPSEAPADLEESPPESNGETEKAEPVPPVEEKTDPPVESKTPPADTFDDRGLLPKSFKVDNILQEMLDEERSEIPDDLTARLDEDGMLDHDLPESQYESEDPFEMEDEDILARALENAGESDREPIDFHDREFLDAVRDDLGEPHEISPMAVELLGENFDFDSLLNQGKPDDSSADQDAAEAPAESPTDVRMEKPAADSVLDLGQGVFRVESRPMTGNVPLLNLISDEEDAMPLFPEELVHNTLIVPDRSEDAEKYSVVEESRPMFVRKENKKR